eukprot:14847069-Alexandrium_andersonii.AAC.1
MREVLSGLPDIDVEEHLRLLQRRPGRTQVAPSGTGGRRRQRLRGCRSLRWLCLRRSTTSVACALRHRAQTSWGKPRRASACAPGTRPAPTS